MKKVIFIVQTEYHMLLTLGIMQNYYPKSEYQQIIYFFKSVNNKRLLNSDPGALGLVFREVIFDDSTYQLKRQLDEIIGERPDELMYFLGYRHWQTYLFFHLKRLGTRLILAPDGMDVYKRLHFKLRQRISLFRKFQIINYRQKIIFPIAIPQKYYGSCRYVDEIWVEDPEFYWNHPERTVRKFCIPSNDRFVKSLNKFFKYDVNEEAFVHEEKMILLIDSSFSTKEYLNKNREVLEYLHRKYPDRRIAMKFHPLTADVARDYFKDIYYITFLSQQVPVELYIYNMLDCFLVSTYSTAMLSYNPNCKYFWTYRLYDGIIPHQETSVPKEFIHVVNQLDEI